MSVAPEASGSAQTGTGQPLVSAGNSDRCPVCGAQLAVDQRYCVECGTRRGAPRFQLASQTAGAATPTGPTVSTTTSRFGRLNSNSALLVGLLILLVALGVGVLIGHNGNAPKSAGQPKVTVNLNGGSAAGSSSAGVASSGSTGSTSGSSSAVSSSTGSSSSSGKGSKSGSSKSTKSASKSTKAAAAATNPNASATGKAGTAAAAKSFSPTATKKSTLGGGCTAGTAGCKGGKQTGNLF